MIEFDINGVAYRAAKLDAFGQLHVSRKIAPILPKLLPALGLFQGKDAEALRVLAEDMGTLATVLGPLADAMAAMPKDDVDMVCVACMSVVYRKQGEAYAPVMRQGGFMFDDIDLGVMLPIVVHVVRDSLGNFIRGFLSKSTAPAETSPPSAG